MFVSRNMDLIVSKSSSEPAPISFCISITVPICWIICPLKNPKPLNDTASGSVVTVLTLQGKVSGKAVKVQMTGGELIIDAKRRGSRVERLFLTGPTNIVCKGQVTDEDLAL